MKNLDITKYQRRRAIWRWWESISRLDNQHDYHVIRVDIMDRSELFMSRMILFKYDKRETWIAKDIIAAVVYILWCVFKQNVLILFKTQDSLDSLKKYFHKNYIVKYLPNFILLETLIPEYISLYNNVLIIYPGPYHKMTRMFTKDKPG